MKNKIFILIAIVSSLFLIDNVKAETTEPVSSKYFDIYSSEILNRIETDYFNTALTVFDTKFNEAYSEYKNDYPYYLTMAYCNYSNSCDFQTYIFDNIPKFKWKIYYGNSNLYQILWNDETGIGNFNYLKAKTKSININQATVINNFEFETTVYNQSNLSWDSLVYGYLFNKDGSRFYQSYGYFIYDSNFDILKEDDHALKSSRENVDIKINDTYYQADDVIPSYNEFKNPKPKKYEFNDIIHDDNIAQTYFNLDLEQLKSNGYNIELNYAVGNYTDNVLSPYLKITYVDNTYAILSQSFNESPIVHVFMGEFNSCLAPDKEVQTVQLVFPMETTKDVDYKIQLTSNVNFNVSYVYDQEFTQNLTTVDLTGKYSLILIPKVVSQNEIFQDFYLNGDLSVRGITDIDNITNASVGDNKVYNGTFRYLTDFRYTVHALQFVNLDYEDYPNLEKSVTFDASYFNYYIVDSKNDTITVINPNTDKKSNIDMSDINFQYQLTNSDKDSKTVFGMFKAINEYIKSLNDIFKIFIDQFNFFYTNLNPQVQLAIKTLFIVIVVCSIAIIIRK